jgi:hypothetical protein
VSTLLHAFATFAECIGTDCICKGILKKQNANALSLTIFATISDELILQRTSISYFLSK